MAKPGLMSKNIHGGKTDSTAYTVNKHIVGMKLLEE
jgi:hypothetical protein